MALLHRWRPEPWNPTAAQKETALRLSEPLIGARGRTLVDGTAELRTLEDGEVRRYFIAPDGAATLVESRSSSGLYRRLDVSRAIAGWVLIAAIVWLVVGQAANLDPTIPFAVALTVISILFLFASEVVMNREIDGSGEQWQRIGGGDF